MSQRPDRHYEFGPFRLDVAERLLLRNGESVSLTPKAFDLLLALVEQHGHLLEKEELLKLVWPDTFVEEANLSYNISLIRKALGEGENGRRYIETVPKRGYRFVASVKEVGPESAGEPAGETIGPPASTPKQFAAENRADTSADSAAGLTRNRSRVAPYIVMALVLAGAVFGLYQLCCERPSGTGVSEPELNILPLTSLIGTEMQPAFSPDGNQIAFVWYGENDDNPDIYIKQVEGVGLLQLTAHQDQEYGPAWSPDGSSIAYVRHSKDSAAIWMMPAIGGAERKLTEVFYRGQIVPRDNQPYLEFSPDGKYLVYSDKESASEPYRIFLFSLETLEKRKLTNPLYDPGDTRPSFSPDGKTLAFIRKSENAIYLMPAAGGEPRRLPSDRGVISDMAWTPDGSAIIAVNRFSYTSHRIPLDGGEIRDIPLGARVWGLTTSRRGRRLAVVVNMSDMNIWRLDLTGSPGQKPSRFISSTRHDDNPEYSADGQRVVFGSDRSGSSQIWVCDSDGSNATQLTFLKTPAGSPRVSPDGRQIAFDTPVTDHGDILLINATGGQTRSLVTGPSEDNIPAWSRDGRWVYFGSNRTGSNQIWKIPVEGGEPIQVTRQGGFEAIESLDGKFIYYARGRAVPGIWRVPVDGGKEELILDRHGAGVWRHWDVTEEGIYFVTSEDRLHPLVEFFNFTSGRVTRIATLDRRIAPGIRGISVAPDGRWLLFTQMDQYGNDIMLVENFR